MHDGNGSLVRSRESGLIMKSALTETTLVDWEKASDQLHKLGRHGDLVLSLFPSSRGLPNIHYKCRTENIPKKAIERDLQKFPSHSLGFVVNPPLSEPKDWKGKRVFGASNAHISHSDCLFLEGDSGISPDQQQSAVQESGLPDPSMSIWTGGKSVHFFWFLRKSISPDKFREVMKGIATKVDTAVPWLGVDMGISNPCRVMRLSGGLHGKTKKRCELRSFSGVKYDIEAFEEVIPSKPKEIGNIPNIDEGWFSRRSPKDQHRLAVEMVSCLPQRNEEGRGEYRINISALYSLKGFFGETEAAQICLEANWYGSFWDPLERLSSVKNPTNSIGTLITLARQYGWELKEEEEQESTSKIKLEDIFPPEIVEPLRLVTKYLPYPDTLIATTYLARITHLLKLGSTINLNPLSGFLVPLNLYVITVGSTGSKKSPLHKALIDGPIEKLKNKEKAEYQKLLSDWYRADGDSRGPKPTPTYLVVQNVTEEALEMVLADHEKKQRGLLYSRDEIKGVFNFDKYKTGKGSEQEQLLELYDGGGFTTIRKEETRICEKTHLSLYGGIQPEILGKLQGSSDHTGKWARCLFSPLPANPTKLAVSISAEERKAFAVAKGKLSSFATEIRRFSGFQYELNDEALELFAEFEYKKQKEAIASKRPSHAAILNKTSGKVGRIAGLLHHLNVITKRVDVEESIEIGVFEKAIRLVEYLDAFAMQFQTDQTRTEKQRWMKRLHTLASKSKSNEMTWSELRSKLSSNERTTLTSEMRKEVFDQLEEANFGELKKGPQGGLIYKVLCVWPEDV